MKGLIIYNDYWSSENTDYCIRMLTNQASLRDINIDKKSSSEFICDINNISSQKIDFVIMRDKMPLIAKLLELNGISVFNSYEGIRICDDKAEMSITLKHKGISVPMAFISPQTYGREIGEAFLLEVESRLGYPMIIKDIHSSLGLGVRKINRREELLSFSNHIKPLLFEEFIPSSPIQDLRVFVVGDKVAGAMKRLAPNNDFRSNIELGGKAEPYEPNEKIKNLAISATKALCLDYAGVDIIPSYQPIVLEVNANACFKTLDKIANTNIAAHIIDYIQEKIK